MTWNRRLAAIGLMVALSTAVTVVTVFDGNGYVVVLAAVKKVDNSNNLF